MDFPLRSSVLLSLLTGCFAPDEAVSGSAGDSTAGDSTDGASTGPSTSATTASTTMSTSSDPDDTSLGETLDPDTTAGDAPPELSNFAVNGSESPSEILEADMVEIQVAADDDVGIDRVEFYDGEELIATFTEPPYRTEFLVTSTENGGHSYTAVAYDTSEQMAEAGPIPLSVSIDGGAVLELQDAGFEATATLGLLGPHLAISENRIYVAGNSRVVAPAATRFVLAVTRMTYGLSTSGTTLYPASVTASTPYHEYAGHGVTDEDENFLVPASVRPTGGDPVVHIFAVDAMTGSVDDALTLPATSDGAFGGIASIPGGGFATTSAPDEISIYPSLAAAATWTTDVGEGFEDAVGVLRIGANADGSVVVSGIFATGGFVRKLASDGDILWTRNFDDAWQSGDFGLVFHDIDAAGNVTAVLPISEDDGLGLRLATFDTDGSPLEDATLHDGEPLFPTDIVCDAGGQLVISALLDEANPEAWAGRFSADGTEIWAGPIDVDSTDAIATGVAVAPDGRLYITGLRDTVSEFLSSTGETWVAELGL